MRFGLDERMLLDTQFEPASTKECLLMIVADSRVFIAMRMLFQTFLDM